MHKNVIQSVYLSGAKSSNALNALRTAAQQEGCFFVKNSPFKDAKVAHNKVLSQVKQFYELPLDEKLRVGTLAGRGATRGYFPIGSESGNKDLIEKKESFSFGTDTSKIPPSFLQESTLVAPNLWHKSFDQQAFLEVLNKYNETAGLLVKLCAEAFGFNAAKMVDETSQYQSFIRSFKYHGAEPHLDSTQTTANSLHSDWNLLTLVWADREGLEVMLDDGSFASVHCDDEEGTLICNFGDFLSSATDGKVRSPWHRVYQPPQGCLRHSFVHFFYPSAYCKRVDKVIYQQNRPLGLFVDQSKSDGTLWKIDAETPKITNMGEMYAAKWRQVSRQY